VNVQYRQKKLEKADKTIYYWKHTNLSGTLLKKIVHSTDLMLFYSDPAELASKKLLWAFFDRLMVSLHSPSDGELYLDANEFRFFSQQFARVYEFTSHTRFSPYMHALVDHVFVFLAQYGTLYSFCCQELERMHKVSPLSSHFLM
jgi:hypothetical protein